MSLKNPGHKVCLICNGVKECPKDCQRGDEHDWCTDGAEVKCPKPEETITTSSTGGKKGVKPERFCFIPYGPLMAVTRVFGYGVQKYGDTPDDANWRKGYEWSKNFDALNRHIWAFWGGEYFDSESKMPHLAHAVWHLLVLMTFHDDEKYKKFDDRPKG